MNILIILSRLDKTGMTTNTIDLCEGLAQEGHNVTLLLGKQSDVDSERFFVRLKSARVKIKFFSAPIGINKVLSVLQMLWCVLISRADVIHVESPYLSFIPWLLGKKFVSTLHVNDLVKCFYYKNATHLIAISDETKKYAMDLYNYKAEEITIVPHGVSTKFADPIGIEEKNTTKKKLNVPLGKTIIGLVGSIEIPRKGHDLLIKAFCMLPESVKENCHLVFLGSDKSEDQHCKKWLLGLIDEYHLQDKVTLIEYCDPIPVYKCFDLAVLPSRLEGFMLTAIEAMMAGVCTLRSDVEGASVQIDHGINGFIFRNEDVDQIREQMLMVLSDDELRIRIAKAGQEKALEKFSISAMAKNTLKVYEHIK